MSRTIAEREALRLARYAYERVGKLTPGEWELWLAGEMLRDQGLELTAERRRIRKAIRAEIARVEEECDAMAREPLPNRRRNQRAREDCARIVQGLDVALRAVAVTRNRKDGV